MSAIILEASDRIGRGVAYSTSAPHHLLNVRAEAMSAWCDKPADFADFWQARGGSPRDFAPRNLFGGYMEEVLADAIATGRIHLIKATVTEAREQGGSWSVTLSDGRMVTGRHLVLATGNEPAPTAFPLEKSAPLIVDSWSSQAEEIIGQVGTMAGDILVLGTGLTMIDTVLSLDSAGYSGTIYAVSRRGQVPLEHADFAPAPVSEAELPMSLMDLLRWVRGRAKTRGWRAAVDALRPYSQKLWQQLSNNEKERFLRHCRPYWDAHRHRVAPQVSERVAELRRQKRLRIIAGRVVAMREERPFGTRVEIARRGAGSESAVEPIVRYVFNCTGALTNINETKNPLLRQLMMNGSIQADELQMGIMADPDGRVIPHASLWAVGPLIRGQYWETTAVREIRSQVTRMADRISKAP
jgi:uncharacterized NAD(P)/FAD-binding protein YdhS